MNNQTGHGRMLISAPKKSMPPEDSHLISILVCRGLSEYPCSDRVGTNSLQDTLNLDLGREAGHMHLDLLDKTLTVRSQFAKASASLHVIESMVKSACSERRRLQEFGCIISSGASTRGERYSGISRRPPG